MVTQPKTPALEDEEWNLVLCELAQILTPFGNDFVVVGGLVPWVLFADNAEKPDGTKDVDLVIRPSRAHSGQELKQILNDHGYKDDDPANPCRYFRTLQGGSGKIAVDFLTSIFEEERETVKEVMMSGIHSYASTFFELAFKDPVIRTIKTPGTIPVGVKFSNIAISIILKAVAMQTRSEDQNKPKDAQDLYYCIKHYPGGCDNLSRALGKYLPDQRVRTGLDIISAMFSSPDSAAVKDAVRRENPSDPETAQILRRTVFELIDDLLKRLKIRS